MNPPEMIVDDIYNAGCFEITDLSLLGEEAEFDNVAGLNQQQAILSSFDLLRQMSVMECMELYRTNLNTAMPLI